MKIFGSISELVDLAFRLAGGKQVKLKSALQTNTTGGTVITVNVPDVAETGVTQNMVLTAATQSLSNKTLSSPTISGGTINNSIIGGLTPVAGSFTAIVGDTLDINTSAELQTLTIPSMSTAGVLHNNSSGAVSSSLVVNADVDAAAAIAFSKLASLASGSILIGSATNVATAASNAAASDVDLSYSAGEVTIALKSGVVTDTEVAVGANIKSNKIRETNSTGKRPIVTDSSGLLNANADVLTHDELVYWDNTNGKFQSVTGVSSQEAGYLSNVTSDIQTQINGKASSGANSDITSLTGLTTMLAPSQGGTGVNNGSNTLTLAGPLTTSGNFTTTLTVTNNTSLTLPTSGTLATTSNKLSAFAATSSSELAGVISDETGSGSLVFGTNPTLATPTLNGHRYGVSGSLTVTANTLTPTADRSIQVVGTGATLQMIANPADGQEFILINASGSDFTIANNAGGTAANRIFTGTGADFTFKASSAVSVVYNSTLSRWVLGGGGGGAGGLATTYVTAGGITAVNNTHYLTNLSASGQTITLPSGTDGAVIRFSDAGEVWNVYPLTIAPATGQRINNLATNETLVCDVKGGWVELSFNSTYGGWALMSLASTTGTSGSGSGEINAISNLSAASDTTGWTNASRVTSGSPLDPVVSTALSIANAAGAESSTSGGYFSIASLPSGLRSRKLKVSFYFSTPATDVYRVSVYAGSTRLSLSSDSAGATTLPANVTGGYFEAYFDSTTATAYSLNVTRTSGSTGACVITQVIVGPGINAQGAAISEWQDFTPSTSQGFGTITVTTARYRRVGSSMEVFARFDTGTVTGDQARLGLPSGFTVSVGANVHVGDWQQSSAAATTRKRGRILTTNGVGYVLFSSDDYTTATGPFSALTGSSVSGGANVVSVQFTVPIAEWAGNGTVNLGAGAQVEYASNSDISSTASVTASGFIYGPSGQLLTSASWSLGTNYTRRVRFQYPIQTDDLLQVEINFGQAGWMPLAERLGATYTQNNVNYGASISVVNSTDVDVTFGNGGYGNPASFGGNGSAWNIAGSWRVRKAKASAPVGFGLAKASESGLVAPRRGQYDLQITGGGWSNVRSKGIYYQDQDGNHRLKFNISGNISLTTSYTGTIAGVTFANNTYGQPVASQIGEAGVAARATLSARADSNAGTFTVISTAGNFNFVTLSGDVELASKPTWA